MTKKSPDLSPSCLKDIDQLANKYSFSRIQVFDKGHTLVGLCLSDEKHCSTLKKIILDGGKKFKNLFFAHNDQALTTDFSNINKLKSNNELVEQEDIGKVNKIDCQVTVEERTQLFGFINKG